MNVSDFLTTFCSQPRKNDPVWRPLYDDAAHGKRPADDPFDEAFEMDAYQSLAGEARAERAAYLLDVLNNTSDTDFVPEVILSAHLELLSESELTHAFADVDPDYVAPAVCAQTSDLQLSARDIAAALAIGDDPLALNLATATYDSPNRSRANALLAIAQIAARFEDQLTIDRLLRPGSATVILCEREEDVAPLQKALLRFRARPVVNDFEDPKPVPPATIIILDRDPHGLQLKRALDAVSEAPALVVITSDPCQLLGCLAHLPMVHIGAPSRDLILAVMADVSSATGQISVGAVCTALPPAADLTLLSREALVLAFRERGPIRAARRMSALARKVGGSQAAAHRDAKRLSQTLSAAASAVVSYIAGAEVPIAISMTRNGAVVHTDPNTIRHTPEAVSGRLAGLLAGEALRIIQKGKVGAEGPTYARMRLQATRLAIGEALGLLEETNLNVKPDTAAIKHAFGRDKALRPKISRRLDDAQKQATTILNRNLAAVDLIASHLLADGAVPSATLVDLFVSCAETKW